MTTIIMLCVRITTLVFKIAMFLARILYDLVKSFVEAIFAILFNGSVSMRNIFSRRMHKIHHRMDASELLSYNSSNHSVMITGGTVGTTMRERVETELVKKMNRIGNSVVILHRGNKNLEQRIATIPGVVFCGHNSRRYDPFRDLDADAIADILLDNLSGSNVYNLNIPTAKSYIQGLAEFYLQCRGKRPSLNSLYDCTNIASKGYTVMLNELQKARNMGHISSYAFTSIKALLDAGQSQEVGLNIYIKETLRQLSGCTPQLMTGLRDDQYISLRRAIIRGNILCIDVGTIKNEKVFYNLFVNELEHCASERLGFPYLILDGINVSSSPALCSLLENQSQLERCLCHPNVYAAFNDGKPGTPLFNSLASECAMQITLHQSSGAAANLLSEYYGTYQKQKCSIGVSMGYSGGNSTQYTDVDERICRPDEFTKMSDLDLICMIQTTGSTEYLKGRMTTEP